MFVHILIIGSKRHVQVVQAVGKVEFTVVARNRIGHHKNSVLFVPRHKSAPDVLVIVIQEINRLLFQSRLIFIHMISCF